MHATVERDQRADAVVERLFADADHAFLSSAISREEGTFLRGLASRAGVRQTIEIGCANGISGVYLCSGIARKDGASHTAVDPFQYEDFSGRGVENIRRAGFDFFELVQEPSEIALPALLRGGKQFDLALIDGLHTADQTMVDFYYLDRLLRVGGILVFDDANSRAVNKIVRYAATYPNYQLIACAGRRGFARRTVNAVKHAASLALWPVRKLLRESTFREFFDVSLLDPKKLWSIDSHTMVAFEKTGEYRRDTNWYHGL